MRYLNIIIVLLFAGNIFAQDNGLAFLNIPTDVKAIGMGNVTAVTQETAASLFSNPAALANASTFNVYTAGRFGFMGSNFGVGAFAWRSKEYGSFGFGLLSLGIDEIQGRDENNRYLDDMSSTQTAFYLSYAKSFLSDYSVGMNIKYVSLNLNMIDENVNAGAFGVEFGLMYKYQNWKFGAFIQDNMTLRWNKKNINESPITIKIGAEYHPKIMKGVVMKMDFVQRQKLPLYLNFGLGYEYFVNNIVESIVLRMGTSNIYIESRNLSISVGELNDNNFAFSAGFGIKSSVGGYGVVFDYAFRTHSYLDNMHFTGVTLDF